MIERLLAAQPQGATLPALRFFEPKPSFIDFMRSRFAGQLVYDIGAGCGHVAESLTNAGLNVIAFDLSHRTNEQFPIKIGNAITWRYEPGSVAMFCRPCHGVFVETVIARLRQHKVTTVLYVGLSRNAASDLGSYYRRFRRLLLNVGQDHETLYAWHIPQNHRKQVTFKVTGENQ